MDDQNTQGVGEGQSEGFEGEGQDSEEGGDEGASDKEEEQAAAPAAEVDGKSTPENVLPNYTYLGQQVMRDSMREVEGRMLHNITILDGSSYDLSDEEYVKMITPVVE